MESYSTALAQALTQYLSAGHSRESQDARQELSKFVRWCGRDRNVVDITPQEAERYGELLAASTGRQDTTERARVIRDFLAFCYKNHYTSTSLAKHVRVRKTTGGKSSRNSHERVRTAIDITPEGYQGLLAELESLREERIAVSREIGLAAADKDFRENAPLDAARERQGHLEARIRELEDNVQRARLVETDTPTSNSRRGRKVGLGSRVRLLDSSSKEEMVYTLVNASEASPMDFKMSVASPVGRALMNHTAGEEVEVATPRGNLRYRIAGVE